MSRRITKAFVTASLLVCIIILSGCTANIESPVKTFASPKYQGVILPINEPVKIRFGPFPKSTITKSSHTDTWTDGKLEVDDSVVTGDVESQVTSSGIVLTINMMFGENSPNVHAVIRFNSDRKFVNIDKIRIAGKDIALTHPDAWSKIKSIEGLIDIYFHGYKTSGIVVGDTVYDGDLEFSGFRMSLKVIALGLSNHRDRPALVTSSTGNISGNLINGNYSGYELVDLETGMMAFSEGHYSFQTDTEVSDVTEVQIIKLPSAIIEPKNIEVSSPDQRLQKIKELLDKGFITESEAATKRAEILEGL